MAKTVNCPKCAGSFEVAENLSGQGAHCPTCGTDFTPEPDPVASASAGKPHRAKDRDRVRAALYKPAVALLLVGILGGSVNLGRIARPFLGEYDFIPLLLPPQVAIFIGPPEPFPTYWGVAFLVLNGIVILGALHMLWMKRYWLAMTACCLAVINFGYLVIVLSYPVGVWSFRALSQKQVRSAFD